LCTHVNPIVNTDIGSNTCFTSYNAVTYTLDKLNGFNHYGA